MKRQSWKAVYDCVTGISHLEKQIPCQDACRVIVSGDEDSNCLIIACADGAGSSRFADIGSTLACDQFVKLVQEFLTVGGAAESLTFDEIASWYQNIHIELECRAQSLEVSIRELATTLLAGVIFEESAVFSQIGDGAIVIPDGENFRAVHWPQSGEYANTTNFVTGDNFLSDLAFERVDTPIDEVAVFTDGLERLILRYADRTVHTPFLEPMLGVLRDNETADKFFEPLREFLESPAINSRTDDDKTLILATRRTKR